MSMTADPTSVFGQLMARSGANRDAVLAGSSSPFRRILLVADRKLPEDVRAKLAPFDILQETYVEARRAFRPFRGDSDQELLAWLRQIVLNNVRDAANISPVRSVKCCAKYQSIAARTTIAAPT